MNILLCSAGRRCELINDIRRSMEPGSKIVATDLSAYAPALSFADRSYLVPRIDAPEYIDRILEICRIEQIHVVTTLIDPEILLLAENRQKFEAMGILVLAPDADTANLCFDKYQMFRYLRENGVRTQMTWGSYREVVQAVESGAARLPLFMKPRTGSGSVGARRVSDLESIRAAFEQDPKMIAQELMTGEGCVDLDADAYIDTVSHEVVSAFSKRKLSTTIGGANKTISFKDERLFAFIREICKLFRFNGPIDMDFFYKDGEYYLSEINPRFGGAYLHAYGAGVDFIKLIEANCQGIANRPVFGAYQDDIVMMMYDSVLICGKDELESGRKRVEK